MIFLRISFPSEWCAPALRDGLLLGVSWGVQRLAISTFHLHSMTAFRLGPLRHIGYPAVSYLTALGLVITPFSHQYRWLSKACRYLALFGPLNLIHELCLNTLIHELGHGIAALSLYGSKTLPTVKLRLFRNEGKTTATISRLSALGTYLGTDRSKFLFAAAGPFASLAFAMGMFGWASYQEDEATSARMMLQGGIQLLSELAGARTAVSDDYVAMRRLGRIESKHVFRALIILPALQLTWIHRHLIVCVPNRINRLILSLFQSKNKAQQ